MNNLESTTITSLEVAQMVEKEHRNLLTDIRKYYTELGKLKIQPTNFFVESAYFSEQNKKLPCFDITKKGCEFIAHKLTGIKGTEFTAKYIIKFHDIENKVIEKVYGTKATSLGEVASYTKEMDKRMEKQGSKPCEIAAAFKMVSEQFGIRLPDNFVKIQEFEQMGLFTR